MKLLLFVLALTVHQITSSQTPPQDPEVGGYTELDLSEAKNDPTIQAILQFGVDYITSQEVDAGKLPDAEYTVTCIYSVWTQLVSGTNYRFDVDISNNLGWVIRATFVVYVKLSGCKEVTDYVYYVTKNPDAPPKEEFVVPDEGIPGGYIEVDPTELDTNMVLRNAFEAGVDYVVQKAIGCHSLPDSTYELTYVHSIYSQVVSGTNYRFDVDLTNCAGLVTRVVFVVYAPIVPEGEPQTYETTLECLDITCIPYEGLIGGVCSVEGSQGGEGDCDGSGRL